MVSTWVSTVAMLARVFQGFENPNDGVLCWATTIMYISLSVSVLNAFVQRKRVIGMIRAIHEDIQKLMKEADDQELVLMLSTQKYIRMTTWMLWYPALLTGIIAFMDSLYRTVLITLSVFNITERRDEQQYIFLLKVYPFGEVYNNFVFGLLGTWYALGLGINAIPLWNSFIVCLIKYVHLKLLILKKRVTEMEITRFNPLLDLDRLTPAQRNRWRMRLIKEFVKEHLKIRRFVKELEQLICLPVLIDFIFFAVSICFELYALIVGHADLCFALYSTPWYEYDPTMKRTILFMMMHAQSPLQIRALMFPVDLKTFLDIVLGAYNYFNILRGLY
ncbi:odorant receptor 56a-like [Drosophila miranda]|uniref:odorant receptor 56a-like n=1 Tax=Drosophila miranda TaxID=7229 RepID=UPI0007E6E4E4|nr:odorant receptor 56a-like [Drosophila miranda]